MNMRTSEALDAILPAFHAAQHEMPTVPLSGENPHFNSKYTPLPVLWDAVKPVLKKHDLSIFGGFLPSDSTSSIRIVSTLFHHPSSQWIESVLDLPIEKQSPQAACTAITYARRYMISHLFGIVADHDDDGNSSSNVGASSSRPVSQPSSPGRPKASAPRFDEEAHELKKKMGEMILEICEGDIDAAQKYMETMTTDREGKYRSHKSPRTLSDKQAFRFFKIVKKEWDSLQAKAMMSTVGEGKTEDLPF